KVDPSHDSRIVDQDVQLGELSDDRIEEQGNGFRIAYVASKRMDSGRFSVRFLKPGPASASDDYCVAQFEQSGGKLKSDTACAARDQDRGPCNLHGGLSVGQFREPLRDRVLRKREIANQLNRGIAQGLEDRR